MTIPIRISAYKYKLYITPQTDRPLEKALGEAGHILPALKRLGVECREGRQVQADSTRIADPGNMVTLGTAKFPEFI